MARISRRSFVYGSLASLLFAVGCRLPAGQAEVAEEAEDQAVEQGLRLLGIDEVDVSDRVTRTEDEWREVLSTEQFRVLRKAGTERAFTGAYWDLKDGGTYHCAACGNPLFGSEQKYESGTGWPSYWAPIQEGRVSEERDATLGAVRTEVLCSRCGSHLGHVFEDGPQPTGLRYCINSVSLAFFPGE